MTRPHCTDGFVVQGPQRLLLLVAAGLAGFLSISCGPIEYISQVSGRAQKALLLAEAADAPAHAPYEYTMATLFLAKAREKAGRAQFQVSVEMGRRAEDYATRARALSGNRSSAVGPSPALVAPAGNPPGLK